MSREFLIWTAVLIFGILGFKKYFYPNPVSKNPTFSRQVGSTGECAGKDKCVVYYSAPWCPVCETTKPTVLELHKRWGGGDGKIGLKALVGADDPEKCKAKAESIGAFASFDNDAQFAKQYNITSYPTWLVLDQNGNVLTRVSVGVPDPAMTEAFIRTMLKL